ncbi:hypothetical protein [Flavobacterium jejuense]|nr:hypothetical protein [Flavobacterium jejuense]
MKSQIKPKKPLITEPKKPIITEPKKPLLPTEKPSKPLIKG